MGESVSVVVHEGLGLGRLSSTRANLVTSLIEAALRRRMYSDLSMTTIPEPLSGLVTKRSSRFFNRLSASTRALGGEGLARRM